MATLPICRATSAACEVMPPKAVRKPSDAAMPRMSSGEVSWRASTTVSPRDRHAAASSAKKTRRPLAAPGPAGSPFARSLPAFTAAALRSASKIGRSRWFSASGSTRRIASSFETTFSSARSTAIRTAARPVRFPERVWST